ncbi:hypothetical protein SETIT_4G253600v2 [Setaria italica]|uniref:RING-type E3 ubiquitin transferase n=1 Tax=Setaria italica TaxID=4555 RepID=A0A368QY37_SETIT|nr:hypothetical protein SETIT_4G253600v2 [Setaria italica]
MSSAGAVTTIMTSAVMFVPFVLRPPFDSLFDPDFLDNLSAPAADHDRKRARGAGTSDDDDLALELQEVAAAERSDASGEEEECVICLRGFRAEETLRAMPAWAHAFHHHCISEWLCRNPVCPLCRRWLPATNPTLEDEEEDWADTGGWEVEGVDERRILRRRIRFI